jgi:hypothetical protein
LSLFKLIRVVLLASLLFVIVVGTWMTEKRLAAWERPTLVTVYPIVADDDPASREFAEALTTAEFEPVNAFFERESAPYGFTLSPAFRFQVAEVSTGLPPTIPGQFNTAQIAVWSLKMRWWAWLRQLDSELITPDIQMFMLFRGLNGEGEAGISVGMRKGRYGIVRAYARENMRNSNLIVFTHEMLHVLGASDKYVLTTGEPLYPDGYADPRQQPLFPQKRAEIMGGRIPLTAYSSKMPRSLEACHIGRKTGQEIGFLSRLE